MMLFKRRDILGLLAVPFLPLSKPLWPIKKSNDRNPCCEIADPYYTSQRVVGDHLGFCGREQIHDPEHLCPEGMISHTFEFSYFPVVPGTVSIRLFHKDELEGWSQIGQLQDIPELLKDPLPGIRYLVVNYRRKPGGFKILVDGHLTEPYNEPFLVVADYDYNLEIIGS